LINQDLIAQKHAQLHLVWKTTLGGNNRTERTPPKKKRKRKSNSHVTT